MSIEINVFRIICLHLFYCILTVTVYFMPQAMIRLTRKLIQMNHLRFVKLTKLSYSHLSTTSTRTIWLTIDASILYLSLCTYHAGVLCLIMATLSFSNLVGLLRRWKFFLFWRYAWLRCVIHIRRNFSPNWSPSTRPLRSV